MYRVVILIFYTQAGPMMRPQHAAGGTVFMGNPTMARNLAPAGYMPRQRPPNVSVGPDGMPMSNRGGAEWRHILMSQQQNMGFSHVRPFSTHQGIHDLCSFRCRPD